MEHKRALTSVDIRALVTELRAYTGAKLDKAYLYDDGLVRLKLRDFDRGRVELLVEVGDVKRAHVADPDHVPPAPERPPNFAMMLRNRIQGADLVDVRQYEFDRILEVEFERDGTTTVVVAELFGDGNVAVLDGQGEVVSSLATVRLQSRTVAPGARYEYPASRFDPLGADEDAFRARMAESDTDLVRTLATQLDLGGLYAEELCARAGVAKTTAIADATDEQYEALYDALAGLADDLAAGAFDPRVYRDGEGRVVDVAPFALAEREGLDATAHESFNQTLDAYFVALEREAEAGGEDGPDFEAEIAKHERIIDQQEGAIEEFEAAAAREREKAELLYARYDLVDDVLETVRAAREAGHGWDAIAERFAEAAEAGTDRAGHVTGVDPAAGTVGIELDGHEIDLDPAMGVEKNADRLYGEAKRIEEKKAGAEEAVAETREELAAVRERKARHEEGETEPSGDEQAEDDGDEAVDWLARDSIPVRSEEQWYERFRWFHTTDGFLVIGGRDADQNEELVAKYLEPGDRFLHAEAHGGPVTVLKATGPSEAARDVDVPESDRRQAAQFAVSYSSVWKDGAFAGDVYEVDPDQVSKTPESGEYLEKGGFAVRGDRTYYRDVEVGVAVGITCEPETRVVGGPPEAVEPRAETAIRIEPGRYAQNDVAKLLYREFRDRFADTAFVRKVASADRIQEFCPPGGSRIVE